jgi:hypothetical protein
LVTTRLFPDDVLDIISSQADSEMGSWDDISPEESYIEISESMLLAAEHVDAVMNGKIMSVLHSMYGIPRTLSISMTSTYLIYSNNGQGSAVSMKYLADADFIAMVPIEIHPNQGSNASLKVLSDAQVYSCDLSFSMPLCHIKSSPMHIAPRFNIWPFACRDCHRNLADLTDQRLEVSRGAAVILPSKLLLEHDVDAYSRHKKVVSHDHQVDYAFLRYMQGSEYFLLTGFSLGEHGDSRLYAEEQSSSSATHTCSLPGKEDRSYTGLHQRANVIAEEYLHHEHQRLEQFIATMHAMRDDNAGSCTAHYDSHDEREDMNVAEIYEHLGDEHLSIGTCSAPP